MIYADDERQSQRSNGPRPKGWPEMGHLRRPRALNDSFKVASALRPCTWPISDQSRSRMASCCSVQQQVWGVTYIDELVQQCVNSTPTTDNTCETLYWVGQDSNLLELAVQ